jgi:hypothetical protein
MSVAAPAGMDDAVIQLAIFAVSLAPRFGAAAIGFGA